MAAFYSDELLGAASAGTPELLPANTQLFLSSAPQGVAFHALLWLGALGTLLLAGGAMARSHDTALYGCAGALALLTALGAWLLARRAAAAYAAAVRAGEWHYGIILFPTGDIVVNLRSTMCGADTTIEAAYLSRASTATTCSPRHLRPVRCLQLHYLLIDARPAVVTVLQADLRDDVERIAALINDSKAGAAYDAASAFGGALGSGAGFGS